MLSTPICTGLMTALAMAPATFATVVFSTSGDNPNTTVVDATTATVIEDGLTLTASASGGDLDVGATGSNLFGISGNGASTISAASEVLSVSFDADVYLEQIDLNQLGNGETATVSIPSLSLDFSVSDDGSAIVLTPAGGRAALAGITGGPTTGGAGDTIDFASESFLLAAGQTVNISVLDTAIAPATASSVALQGVTVSVVPEPASVVLVVVGALAVARRRRSA